MACHPSGSGSYTVVIFPLRTSLHSLDALRFYLWIKRLKDLEREKDALWCGMEILENTRLWYLQRLEENRIRQDDIETKSSALPPQVSYPEGKRLSGLSDDRAQCHEQQQPLSARNSGRQRPPVAQLSTDSGGE
ncbi:suppressor APC domain-containing protein 1 isoform X2 [Seriola aureovittata]|uniref:suppressor APC domain-containing protein 1 isoform X2 n=1 Tax=Seriola aureovittata TaxID=2871759 RepID=UPI0024BEBFB9|nr:suppressor APC domain-containing protein 1 isoform X2 [Seriola aureovittata]